MRTNIFAAANVNDLAIDSERMPQAVETLIVALAVEFFDVEILHIAVERGESPGHVLVVAGDDERHAGQRDAGGVEARERDRGRVRPCTRCPARGG